MSQISAEAIDTSAVRKWKRYPAYKDSGVEWLGEIPAHWEVKRLKYVVKINSDVLPEITESDYILEYVDISNVDSNGSILGVQELHFIAVEIKSFLGASLVADLEKALGQYILYHDILARLEPERLLYLAVTDEIFIELFTEPIGEILLENSRLRLIVFEPQQEVIVRWIP